IVLPREKDDTDTVFAAKEGLKRGFKSFLLIGCVGKRLDHTAANVSLLLMLDKAGARALMLDDYSEMEIAGEKKVFIPDTFPYFSLLALFGDVGGVTVKNAKYPLDNAEIKCDYQYGVSNEVIPGKRASVSVKKGRLLLIKVF
ncbi:MAG: thiamine diphosphokinase, partial [Clostridia bacterium]|nr:thiamine diphosphokinase [Clostridia bacterium]